MACFNKFKMCMLDASLIVKIYLLQWIPWRPWELCESRHSAPSRLQPMPAGGVAQPWCAGHRRRMR